MSINEYKKTISKLKIKNKVYIYTLSDSETNEIKYVGKTKQSLYLRYIDHISFSNHRIKLNYPLKNWIKHLLNNNKYPIIEIVDIVNKDEWEKEEIFYIDYFKYLGFNLKNFKNGGLKGNEGLNWKWSKKSLIENRKKEINKDKNLFLFDINGKYIKTFQNIYEACNFFNINRKICYNKIKRKNLFNKFYFIFENNIFEKPIRKNLQRKIQVINIKTNNIIIFDSIKDLEKLNIKKYTYHKYVDTNKLFKKQFKINRI